jgi:threonyl-tRNA synthetase
MCNEEDNFDYRSHRKLGEKLGLFQFSDVSPGNAFWLAPGMRLWNALSELWRDINDQESYQEVRSPIVYDAELWKRSGHWEKYKEGMYHFALDEKEWGLKPMNCPAHIDIFSSKPRSYKELPFRLSEQGLVHRYEMSGAVNGLLRARSFSIDDAHIFCKEEQVASEVRSCLSLAKRIYSLFGLSLSAELSLRPEERFGSDELWDASEGALRDALIGEGMEFIESPGGGAFYGPKIDLFMKDSLGRAWQLGSVQLDYVLPRERFDLAYIDSNGREIKGEENDIVIVHRAMFGSFERFIAIILEHFDGALPLWCAPRQVVILPMGEKELLEAKKIKALLSRERIFSEVWSDDSLGKRIRRSEELRVPVSLIIGKKEMEEGAVMLRRKGGAQEKIPLADALSFLSLHNKERSLDLRELAENQKAE